MPSYLSADYSHDLSRPLRMRESLEFVEVQGGVIAKRGQTKRYFLKRWQQDLIEMLDGEESLEDVGGVVAGRYPGEVTSDALVLVACWLEEECLAEVLEAKAKTPPCSQAVFGEVSLFEFDSQDEGPPTPESKREAPVTPSAVSEEIGLGDAAVVPTGLGQLLLLDRQAVEEERVPQVPPAGPVVPLRKWWRSQPAKVALRVGVLACFGLSVLRLAYVAAPVFEPPVERIYAEISMKTNGVLPPIETHRQSETRLANSTIRQQSVSGRSPAEAEPTVSAPRALEIRLARLRSELAECRIRRDEFYLQNNEVGYRIEVEKITELTREIGRIESSPQPASAN